MHVFMPVAHWVTPLVMFMIYATFAVITCLRANRAKANHIARRQLWQAALASAAALFSLVAVLLLSGYQEEFSKMSFWAAISIILTVYTLALPIAACVAFFEREYWIWFVISMSLICTSLSTLLTMAALTEPTTYESSDPTAVNISIRHAWMAVDITTYASFALMIVALVGLMIKAQQRSASMAKM
jgi:hypothetical protein